MNKRQKKKFEKKLHCRRYVDVRWARVREALSKMDLEPGDIPYIILSKNYKRIVKFVVLKNAKPVGIGGTSTKEITMEFSCGSYIQSIEKHLSSEEMPSTPYDIHQMLLFNHWLSGLPDISPLRTICALNNVRK